MNKPSKLLKAILLANCLLFATGAMANADDKKWVAQCMKDNKDEGAKADVVKKYCVCMNDKMDEKETRSITEWEKANPKHAKTVRSRQAGSKQG